MEGGRDGGRENGIGGRESIAQMLALADEYDQLNHIQAIASKPALLVGGWQDRDAPLEDNLLPLVRALQEKGAQRFTPLVLEDQHNFRSTPAPFSGSAPLRSMRRRSTHPDCSGRNVPCTRSQS